MTDEEIKLAEFAKKYLRDYAFELIERFVADKNFLSDERPVSVFMAGSPGAGKTEASKRLIERFKNKPVRIDADEIREWLPGYTGANAFVFGEAAALGVNKLYDHVLKRGFNMILDSTFAYSKYMENIKRSLDRGRKIEIFYLYQDPIIAWDYTKKREAIEHRMVSKDFFIRTFLAARENVMHAKDEYKDKIELNLIISDFTKEIRRIELNIDAIDSHLKESYTVDKLDEILK